MEKIKFVTVDKLREIIPLINEEHLTYHEIALVMGKSTITIHKWVARLREAGFEINAKRGRPPYKL